jgi:hypothetical protein
MDAVEFGVNFMRLFVGVILVKAQRRGWGLAIFAHLCMPAVDDRYH